MNIDRAHTGHLWGYMLLILIYPHHVEEEWAHMDSVMQGGLKL